MRIPRSILFVVALRWVLPGNAALPAPANRPVDFAREIVPIFAEHCHACHGPEKQKSDYRLDRREAAFRGGESGELPILAGKSAESLLIRLVAGLDPDLSMPPKKSDKRPLSAEQIALLRGWIDQGAIWPESADAARGPRDWWSLKPLVSPAVPRLATANPIDAFTGAKLAEKGLAHAPEAERPTLLRRVTFDLTGLPPTTDEVDRFVSDPAPDAYGKVVDRLLASPRYGERWARHWLDVAHFAETHGHDQDRIREHAWPYRDYVIAALNADKPYARFVEEQIAGDVLFPSDPQATVALGFLAAGPWDESSLRDIREDTIDREIGRYLDRDDVVSAVMQTFTSTTVQCARCHDHKFDPVSLRDYYALQAVFAGTDKANRRYDESTVVHQRRRDLAAELRRVESGDRTVLLCAAADTELAAREEALKQGAPSWRLAEPEVFISAGGATLTRQADGSLLASGPHPEKDTYSITAAPLLPAITAVKLEVLPDDSLPLRGPGREANGNLHLSEFELLLFEPGAAAPKKVKLSHATADFNQDGWTIADALDGNTKTAWGIHPNVGQPHTAVFELAEQLVPPAGAKLTFLLKQLHGGHCIGRLRLSLTDARSGQVAVLPGAVAEILAIPAKERSDAQRIILAQQLIRDRLLRETAALPPPRLVFAGASDFEPDGAHKPLGSPRPVHVLKRGDVRQPLELAVPGALACLAELPARFALEKPNDEGARRAALARWIVDPRNPLTWRSIVNRVWHYHFGRGLAGSPNDFGRMGATPTHPELLDWLAVWFRDEAHGSLKALHRLIVTSATYRQASARRAPENSIATASSDPENRYYCGFPRQRLDADALRDAVLAVSGRLDLRMGGPSDRHFDLKPGIHVTPRIDYAKFDVDAGRRRSIYRFLFRTLPDPMMAALDCPAGDQLTPVRNTSVTVQQALALWNSAFVARHSEHFATRLSEGGGNLHTQVAAAVNLAFNRRATDAETRELSLFAEEHGLANLCRVLLNSDEFFFID